MKKALISVLLLLVVSIVGVIGYLLIQADSIVAKLKPEIEAQGSAILKSTLTIGDMHLRFFPSIAFSLDSLTITDEDERNGQLSIGGGAINVSLLKLLSGTIAVTSISLDSPAITVRQTPSGFRVDGISRLGEDAKDVSSQAQKQQPVSERGEQEKTQPLPKWLQVNLDSIALTNGSFEVYQESGESIAIHDLNLQTDVELAGSTVSISDLALSLKLVGQNDFQRGDFQIDLSTATIDLETLRATVKAIEGVSSLAEGALKAKLSLKDSQFSTNKIMIRTIALDGNAPEINEFSGELRNVSFSPDETKIAIEDGKLKALQGEIDVRGALSLKNLSGEMTVLLQELQKNGEAVNGSLLIRGNGSSLFMETKPLKVFGGEILAESSFSPKKTPPPFSANVTVASLEIERALQFVTPDTPALITGTLEKLTAVATGSAGANIAEQLQSDISVTLRNGTFTGGNLMSLVLQSLQEIPFVKGTVGTAVPDEHSEQLTSPHTAIEELRSTARIAGKQINITALTMKSPLFLLESKGTIGFDQSLNLKTTFRFTPTLSLAIVAKVAELNKLLDNENRLVIPLQLLGTASAPLVVPNIEEIMKLGAGKVLQEKAADLIGKAFGKGKSSKSGKKLFGF